jgi:hypothetical protein
MSVSIPVTVTRNSLTIKECPPELADALAYVRNRISFERGDLKSTPERVSYIQYEAQTKICRTYPNALHLIQTAGHKLGLNLEVKDQRLRPPLDLNRINKEDYPGASYHVLDAVAKAAASGVILQPDGETRPILCGLVRMLPLHFKILVTTDDPNAANQVHEALTQALSEERIGLHLKPRSARARIMVTHLDALKDFVQGDLAYSGYALRDFDAWICDEVHRLSVPNRISFLNQFRPVYAWGLTATPARADNSHQLISVIFGPALGGKVGQETLGLQTANVEMDSFSTRVFVFPLAARQPIADDLSLHDKVRIAYLKNPALGVTLRGIDASLAGNARVMVLVDSLRLAIILSKDLPHYMFVHGRQDPEHRQEMLEKLCAGEIRRILVAEIDTERFDLPEADYVIDCRWSPNLATPYAKRTARSSDGRLRANHLMLLCLASEQLFNDGIGKLQKMSALGWQVTYMFGRDLVDKLPFAWAPLLSELGTFPEA